MTKTFDETVDEILLRFDLYEANSASDALLKILREDSMRSDNFKEAKAALYKAIEEMVIGDDEINYGNYDTFGAMRPNSPMRHRDNLRASQRQILESKGEI